MRAKSGNVNLQNWGGGARIFLFLSGKWMHATGAVANEKKNSVPLTDIDLKKVSPVGGGGGEGGGIV